MFSVSRSSLLAVSVNGTSNQLTIESYMLCKKMLRAVWLIVGLCLFGDWLCVQGRPKLRSYIKLKHIIIDKSGHFRYNDTCETHTPNPGDVPDRKKKGPFRPIVFKVGQEVVTDDCFRCKCAETIMRCDLFGVNTFVDFVAPKGCHYAVRGCAEFSLVKNHDPADPCNPEPT